MTRVEQQEVYQKEDICMDAIKKCVMSWWENILTENITPYKKKKKKKRKEKKNLMPVA